MPKPPHLVYRKPTRGLVFAIIIIIIISYYLLLLLFLRCFFVILVLLFGLFSLSHDEIKLYIYFARQQLQNINSQRAGQ